MALKKLFTSYEEVIDLILYLNERMTEEIDEIHILRKGNIKRKEIMDAAATEEQLRLERKRKLREKLERYLFHSFLRPI